VSVPALKLAKNDIGDVGAAAIASLIKNNQSILHVDLSNNSLSDAGVAVLCEVLKVVKEENIRCLELIYDCFSQTRACSLLICLAISSLLQQWNLFTDC
jgi:Ran GTPase-activating protein (RanGAP) involved in mRNA processing and transport